MEIIAAKNDSEREIYNFKGENIKKQESRFKDKEYKNKLIDIENEIKRNENDIANATRLNFQECLKQYKKENRKLQKRKNNIIKSKP